MEYLLFPKDNYYLTQGYGTSSFSHNGRKALDISGKLGNKNIYAPFNGYVAKKYVVKNNAYTIWLVSNDKVLCANGKAYYIVTMFTHPYEIANLKVGQTFDQGQLIMTDGDTGNATGKHLDMEIAVYSNKKDIKVGWRKTAGTYGLINAVNPCDYMLLKDDTKILNDKYLNKKYSFKYIKEVFQVGSYVTLANMYVRKGPSVTSDNYLVKDMSFDGKKNATSNNPNDIALYKKGTIFDALEIIYNSNNDIWAKTYSGYVNLVNGKYLNCQKK